MIGMSLGLGVGVAAMMVMAAAVRGETTASAAQEVGVVSNVNVVSDKVLDVSSEGGMGEIVYQAGDDGQGEGDLRCGEAWWRISIRILRRRNTCRVRKMRCWIRSRCLMCTGMGCAACMCQPRGSAAGAGGGFESPESDHRAALRGGGVV